MLPNRDACTGCGGCAAVCPKGCIHMETDAEGFLYPQIDEAQCIRCRKCEKSCAVLQLPKVSETVQSVAARNSDGLVRQESSSGGVFTALAETVIRGGGAVCGAVYNAEFAVEHRIAFSMEEVAPMRGAKYSQSYAGALFAQLKQLLAEGRPVMFVGTPCQCAALKTYLGKDEEKLILVDMICHGVPSPVVWKNYVNQRASLDTPDSKLASVDLRDKSTGWSGYAYSVMFRYTDGSVYTVPQSRDPYLRGFTENLYLRHSCSQCSFKGINRCSDLTLGDCWGIWDSHPEFDDNKGTSLLLIQSSKGQAIWNDIKGAFQTVELNAEEAVNYNPSAMVASVAHPLRAEFFGRLRAGEPVVTLIWDLLIPKQKKSSAIKGILRRILPKRP